MEKNKHSVLIVDDENTNIIAFTKILSSEYTLYAAKDGQSAITTAQEFLPDVILLDILMPDMDGYEVITALKKSPKTREIPVIFISGLSSAEEEEKGLALGAADYIVKPFTCEIVKLRLRNQIKMLDQLHTIERLSEETQAASRSKSAFLAMMSHEIRTPMNAIWGITEILMQSETLSAVVAEGLGKIHNSCDLLLGLINDILDFSKIDAGKLDIISSCYKIASLINDSIHLNMMRIDGKPIEFKLLIDENIPAKLIGDELRIKQILNNLLSNAFKYTDTGSVTLRAACEPAAGKDAVTLVLSVQDTGHGMTKDQMDRLFVEYSRFNQGRSRTIEGTGLGLVITQRLIKLMGGEINVQSEAGKGSLFTVRLPQGTVDGEVIGKEIADNLQKFRNFMSGSKHSRIIREPMPYGSILIVDDVETNLDVAEGLMKPYGLKLDLVMSGYEAIEKIKNGNVYDIIFMDHMMPEMDGIETTRHLREAGYTKPIVALTANAVSGQADMFLQNGFDAFISKPIDIRQLNSVLIKLIRDKQPPEVIQAAQVLKTNQQQNEEDTGAQQGMQTILKESFVRDTQKAVTVFEELLQNGELETEEGLRKFTITVHGIKSSLGNIGENLLSETAYKLEQSSRDGDISFIKKTAPDFLQNLLLLLEKLKSNEETDAESDDKTGLQKKLLAIKAMCADYNRKGALDLLAEVKNCTKETRLILDSIKEKVLHSDFEEAENQAQAFAAVLESQ